MINYGILRCFKKDVDFFCLGSYFWELVSLCLIIVGFILEMFYYLVFYRNFCFKCWFKFENLLLMNRWKFYKVEVNFI